MDSLRQSGAGDAWLPHIEAVDGIMRQTARYMRSMYHLTNDEIDDLVQDSWLELLATDWPKPGIERIRFARLVITRNVIDYIDKRNAERRYFVRLGEKGA